MPDYKALTLRAIQVAYEAGQAILEIYDSEFAVEHKDDKSPLTEADTKADQIIKKALSQTDYPILSEEGKDIAYAERKDWQYFWLVDPLDGTKEFIKRNGEFTVNIALVHKEKPVLGVIFVPVQNTFYFAAKSIGSYKLNLEEEKPFVDDLSLLLERAQELPIEEPHEAVRVVASRSHINEPTQNFIEELKSQHDKVEIVSKGSSLKLCLVAEGKADIYPRFGPTMEWDTAAGQAIAELAKRKVLRHENGNEPLTYNKKNLKNPWFIVQDEQL